jgi:hypothetical protein
MNRILRTALVLAGATLATPALAWTVYPDVDFEWYANVGRTQAPSVAVEPAARKGYIWSHAHWEVRDGDSRQVYVPAHWIRDDYQEQVALYTSGRAPTIYASGSVILLDRNGNIIPVSSAAYPVDSSYR